MRTHDIKSSFASRMIEICTDMGLPEHGRQTMLAEKFKISQGATKKWLSGEGYPTMEKVVAICDWAGVTVNWLLQGIGPKHVGAVDTKSLVLGEAIESMADDDRQQVLDFIGYKFERPTSAAFAGEKMARYMKVLDAFKNDKSNKG